jgi:hypothetical protein
MDPFELWTAAFGCGHESEFQSWRAGCTLHGCSELGILQLESRHNRWKCQISWIGDKRRDEGFFLKLDRDRMYQKVPRP